MFVLQKMKSSVSSVSSFSNMNSVSLAFQEVYGGYCSISVGLFFIHESTLFAGETWFYTANLPPSCSSGNVRPNLAVPIPYTGIPPKQTLKLRWFDPPYWIFHAWIKFRMAYQHCLNQFCAFSIYHLPEQVPPNSNSQLLCMQKTDGQKCIISAFSPDPSSIIVCPCQ